ncbi:SLC13 family permease [Pseudorhodoferax sp.]|uniref:SLC13 family permease n=1 Tax=Pseudorhodoferax sp. TaxID=1993553 RepID=UPI002DD6B4DC|nr:SLC13 family permease [Pseudorhodoferax sp.]
MSALAAPTVPLPPAGAHRRWLLAAALGLAAAAATVFGLPGAGWPAQAALLVFVAALLGWSLLRLDDLPLALLAGLALVAAGAVPASALYASLGSELVWLMLGASVLAAVLQASGLAERCALRAVAGAGSVAALFHRLNLAIGATAFLVPSTSARAALLLPVFLVLARALGTPRLVRALALLFPTSILLSAGASLLGAGAHLVAVEFIARETGQTIGFLRWAVLGLPLALLASSAATAAILRLFLDRGERRQAPGLPRASSAPLTPPQRGVAAVALATLALWCAGPWLGLQATPVALAGALAATWPALTGVRLAQALQRVEWGLLLFLAATTLMGRALLDTGAATLLAQAALRALPLATTPAWALLLVAAATAVLLHLAVPSRTARAVLLLPSVALPFAAAGADLALLAFVCVQGTGFCQSFVVSAKPLAVYARAGEQPAFTPADLLRLAAVLGPAMVAWLALCALWIWPALGME